MKLELHNSAFYIFLIIVFKIISLIDFSTNSIQNFAFFFFLLTLNLHLFFHSVKCCGERLIFRFEMGVI